MIKVITWIREKDIISAYQEWENKNTLSDLGLLRACSHEMPDELLKNKYEYIEDAIIKELIENQYIICGDTHQYNAIPVFEDGYIIFSMRKWAEIMEKAYNLIAKSEKRNKNNFYLASLCDIKERLPKYE